MHSLLGMCCLVLAVKMHENCILDFEQASELCFMESQMRYTVEMFHQAEFQIYKQMNFDLNIPTALDLLLQTLFLEDHQNDNQIENSANTQIEFNFL